MNTQVLVESHFKLAKFIARRECKRLDYWDVDELISVACLALMRSAKTFSESVGVKFSTYCGKLVEWEVRSEVRRQRRRWMERVVSDSCKSYKIDYATDFDTKAELADMREAIKQLTPPHQELISNVLRGESIGDIARQRGVSKQAIQQQLDRAKLRLNQIMKAN